MGGRAESTSMATSNHLNESRGVWGVRECVCGREEVECVWGEGGGEGG